MLAAFPIFGEITPLLPTEFPCGALQVLPVQTASIHFKTACYDGSP